MENKLSCLQFVIGYVFVNSWFRIGSYWKRGIVAFIFNVVCFDGGSVPVRVDVMTKSAPK